MFNLKVHIVQANLIWENAAANIEKLNQLIDNITDDGIIVLPEMFATGFTMNPEVYAQTMDGTAVAWMKEKSIGRVICGSLSIVENGNYFNRFIWVENGEVKGIYNKRHLFSHGAETEHYTAGDSHLIMEYKGWKIMPLVCYDLRFPAWCRNTTEAHLQLFVANWPTVRINAWEKLLLARAIENQAYVVGANRVGQDGNGIAHNGNSLICDPKGEILAKNMDKEAVIHCELNAALLLNFRSQFPVLNDADNFTINDETKN